MVVRNDLFNQICKEIKETRENLVEFKEIPLPSMSENKSRLLEHSSMNKAFNEIVKKYEELGRKFKVDEEKSIENVRTSILLKKSP